MWGVRKGGEAKGRKAEEQEEESGEGEHSE